MDESTSLMLPNGCVLHPGGRVRLLREQVWLIDHAKVKEFNLLLDDEKFSSDTEVIYMGPKLCE